MILRNRILLLAALLVFLFLSLITYTLSFFSAASSEINRIVGSSLAVEKTAETLNSTILQIRSDIWDTMVFDLDHRRAQVERLDAQAKIFYQGLRDLADTDPQFTQTSKDLRDLFQRYYLFGSSILELPTLDDFVGQSKVVEKFRQNQAALLVRLSETLAASKVQFFGSMEKLDSEFSTTTLTAFGLSALVTLLSFAVAVLMARRLSRPLERLTSTVHKVSGGDYSVRPALTSSGEIRTLTETFITMLDQIEGYSTRMEDLVQARTDALVRTNTVMVKELKLAQKIQDALIPHRFPQGPLVVAGTYLPMEDLGGDFYDVSQRTPEEWTIVMADVSGHGVPAALVTAMVKISLGLHGPQTDPGSVLEEVNRELFAAIGDLRRYVTMVLCHVNLKARTLSYCNAGHNEMIVQRSSGDQELYGPNSGVVGLRSDELFLTRTVAFAPGDSLILFTDGLIEARGADKKEFGLERLKTLISWHGAQGPAEIINKVSQDILTFSGDRPRQDDIALLAVKWDASAAPSHSFSLTPSVSAPTTSRAEELYRAKEFSELLLFVDGRLTKNITPQEAGRLYHWKAMVFHHQRRYPEALQAWDKALAADPDNQRARRNRSFLARHLGVP